MVNALRFAACGLAVLIVLAAPARAVTLLRDAGIEHGLAQLAAPVLRAAGLNAARVKILVVDDSTLNAFVVSNDAIFLNAGLITRSTSAEMLQAVIAHEAAHIANGHISRRITNLGAARTAAGLGLALSAIAAAAGGGQAAAGVAAGTQSAAQRAFLRHTRAEEASADQSALRFMQSSGISPHGMRDVLDLFRGTEALSESRQDPYTRSHPLTRDRLRAVDAFVDSVPASPTDPNAAYWFARVKGKLTAHTQAPRWSLRRAGDSGYKSVAGLRAAIAHNRNSATAKAVAAIDTALAERPGDAFLLDAKAQILMDARQFDAAARVWARAVDLAPRDALILAGYGRALLASGRAEAARDVLARARSIDFRDGSMLRDLAQAYAKTGQTGMAALASAERYALRGRLDTAQIHAKRASDLLPAGSGPWQVAQDILIAAERAAKTRRN